MPPDPTPPTDVTDVTDNQAADAVDEALNHIDSFRLEATDNGPRDDDGDQPADGYDGSDLEPKDGDS